jgi:hypothetical protein
MAKAKLLGRSDLKPTKMPTTVILTSQRHGSLVRLTVTPQQITNFYMEVGWGVSEDWEHHQAELIEEADDVWFASLPERASIHDLVEQYFGVDGLSQNLDSRYSGT